MSRKPCPSPSRPSVRAAKIRAGCAAPACRRAVAVSVRPTRRAPPTDDLDTVSAQKKVLRSLHAIRHLPPERIAWRLVQRSRRRLAARFPDTARARLRRRAAALVNERASGRIAAFAREKARQQGLTATSWRRRGGERRSASRSTGTPVRSPIDAPVSGPTPDANYLWAMSSSYLDYLLADGEAAGEDDGTAAAGRGDAPLARPAARRPWPRVTARRALGAWRACTSASGIPTPPASGSSRWSACARCTPRR